MGIRYAMLIASAILSSLALAMGQSNEVGAFDITNTAAADIRARCLALGDQGYVLNLGDINLTGDSKWGAQVHEPATSILCTFSLLGKKDVSLSMWETNFSSFYNQPVECHDCHWAVDEIGFAVVNPKDGQYVQVAIWKSNH